MKKRVLSGLAIIAIIILMFVSRMWTPYIFDACMGLIIVGASFEMSKMMLRAGYYNYTILACVFPVILYAITMTLLLLEINIIIVFASVLIALVGLTLLTYVFSLIFKKWLKSDLQIRKIQTSYSNFSFRKSIYTLSAFIYPTVFMFFLIFMNHMPDFGYVLKDVANFGSIDLGLIALVIAFLIPIISDTFAMLIGMALRGPKLSPKTSPNKTIAGFVGGTIMSTLFIVALYFILISFNDIRLAFELSNITLVHFAMMGLFGSIIATLGDLFESLLKRKAVVKDSGNIIPGHGGVLDRVDSHVFNAVFIFFFFFILLL